jgi:two-component system, NtrC family, response regulator HydG
VLAAYDWPGNARELRNALESAIAVGSGGPVLHPEDLFALREAPAGEPQSFHEAKERIISDFERRYVRRLLDRNGGNVTRAAKEAGSSRNALQALMKRVGHAAGSE